MESLQQKIDRVGGPIPLLRDAKGGRFRSPYPDQYTSWQDEQAASRTSAVLLDQSHHMTDVYLRGSDVVRLLEATGTNSFANFGVDRAKHLIVCAPDGNMIGSTVLFGLEDEAVSLVGPAGAANWIQFHAERGGYDVEFLRDERSRDAPGKGRAVYRFEVAGPAANEILRRASNGTVTDVPFFRMNRFRVGDSDVRGLSHTMAVSPGSTDGGLEIFGPAEDGEAVWHALLTAGEDLGLREGGMYAYYTAGLESGYAAQPTPAVYTSDETSDYRDWLPGNGYEGTISVGGSFVPDSVEGYYVNPYDFGYGHLVKFDHDFIGRGALEQVSREAHRKKVWLEWDDDAVRDLQARSFFEPPETRPKFMETPLARYARVMADRVIVDDRFVGVSTLVGYTVNQRHWSSIGFIDERHAVDGQSVEVVWGEPNGGSGKPHVERHAQTVMRATVHVTPLV